MNAPRPTRLFAVADVLSGQVNLDHYPFRYICIAVSKEAMGTRSVTTVSGAGDRVDQLCTAVEILEHRGWELVTMEPRGLTAFLRRR
jgi:hypothetical protein